MTTETKPRVKTPAAEVVGTFEDVLRRGPCEDGRDLWVFDDHGDWDGNCRTEKFVLASSELQAWKALHGELGTVVKVTNAILTERTRLSLLQLMEEQNGDTETDRE